MSDERKDLTEKIRWLLFLRVVILSFFLGAAGLFHFFKVEGDPQFYTLLIPLIVAYVISMGSVWLLPRIPNLSFFAHLQVDFDVLLITGIIWMTGDIASPFPFLYNLAVMNGAILLFYRGAFFTAGFSSLCYAALLTVAGSLNRGSGAPVSGAMLMPVVLNIGSFFTIAWLGGFLASKLSETERLLKEKRIDYQELEALKETLLQGVGSGVAITDTQGRINYFNGPAQHLTSLQEATVKGKKLDQIFSGLTYNFDGRQEARRVIAEEITFTDPQGQARQIRLTVAPLSNAGEQLIGFISIFEDITRQKGFEEKVRLEEELRKVREFEFQNVPAGVADTDFQFEGVIGKSGGMEKIYHLIQKVAAGNANVLITGESGTGKELVARAVHYNGPRREGPFVAVNCGAIPETLIESELFGHVRGAFTGAVSDRAGLFKQADQGTIFLDEVGELPLHLQVKLLRVLQEKTFAPVGGNKQVKVDVRVFIGKFAGSHGKQVEEISSGALRYLLNYSYSGNVRELENIIEHAVAVTRKSVLTEDDLPSHVKDGVSITEEAELFEKTAPGGADVFFNKGLSLDIELETHEKCILLGALKRANGVQKRAAELLGINYRSLRHRLEKYDLLNSKNQSVPDEVGDG